ncbi:substrate-binding periplasmic protein [Pseudomonas sp. KU43P]|uniref:substrate-binding periplasmic protein n=1 Tax=Pseudomonas sp. KU43P TaxID=2487887 RepID=UPI0012AA85B4|nr:ABC transporter substrate-binding protein [Pseudomonas sp. KU43P]BBH45762.1 amino acid ABC transporter substrate-binding protein [Pseudomonas sp. KU43P]
MTESNCTPARFHVICADLPAPPLFWRDKDGYRHGYESDVARQLSEALKLPFKFEYQNWGDFYPALDAGKGEVILCGQGISAYRKTLADFTEPYAIFDEAVMVLAGSGITSAADLAGKRVGAIDKSINMALAETFEGCICVPFGGDTDDVLADMVNALREGKIDAFVDDDVALVPLADEADLELAFVVKTQNKWGMAVKKGNPAWLAQVNEALAMLKSTGKLKVTWEKWMPALEYPFS